MPLNTHVENYIAELQLDYLKVNALANSETLEVAEHGSLQAVLPSEQLLPAAREVAAKIAANAPTGVCLAKEALNGIEGKDVNKCYCWEQGFTLELYTSAESAAVRTEQLKSGFKK